MYNIFSTSSSYYFDEYSKEEQTIDNVCIICWINPEDNNETVPLQQISFITTNCNCNPYLHIKCFNSWLDISDSCPICRKKIYFTKTYLQIKNDICKYCISCYILLFNYFILSVRIISFVSFLNFFIVIMYNIYFYYYIKFETEEDENVNYYL